MPKVTVTFKGDRLKGLTVPNGPTRTERGFSPCPIFWRGQGEKPDILSGRKRQ